MRRKQARTILWTLLGLSAGMAVFGPRLPGLQATAALVTAPVSVPARGIGHWVAGAFDEGAPLDRVSPDQARDVQAVYAENHRMRQRLAWLEEQMTILRDLHEDRALLGQPVLSRCIPAFVIGVVAGENDLLQIASTRSGEFRTDMPVLHYGDTDVGIAGAVSAVGAAGGAQVRLISDPSLRVAGRFVRYDPELNQTIPLPASNPLVEGAGDGLCQIARHRKQELDEADVKAGDWVVLSDEEWPEVLQGFRIGRVVSIKELPDAPGFARVLLEPAVDLRKLDEVMVMVR